MIWSKINENLNLQQKGVGLLKMFSFIFVSVFIIMMFLTNIVQYN